MENFDETQKIVDVFDEATNGGVVEDETVIGGMDKYEMAQFYRYLMGQSLEAPEVLNKMMNNLINKISMSLGYTVVNNTARQAELAKFMAEAEKVMFNPDSIGTLTDKELRDKYKEAKSTLMGLQEFSRKFVVQNRDTLKVENSKQEKLMNKLMALPPEKLEAVTKIIEEAEKEKEEASTPSAVESELTQVLEPEEETEESGEI